MKERILQNKHEELEGLGFYNGRRKTIDVLLADQDLDDGRGDEVSDGLVDQRD